MGIFNSKPTKAETNAFARGKNSSAKVAKAYAQRERDKQAAKRAGNLAARSAAHKKKQSE